MVTVDVQLMLAFTIAGLVGAAAGFLGTLMLTKRMALVGGPLGHLTLPGIALALIYGFDVSLGALAFLIIGVSLIWLLERKTRLPMEALTAVVFSSSLAVAFLFLPEEETVQALVGDISQISPLAVAVTAVLALAAFWITKRIYKEMVFATVSEDLARTEGINIKKYNLIYLACIALVVALSVRVVGGLLTASLVAIPAATSRNLSKNLSQYAYGGMALGGLASILGVLAFKVTGIPAGPSIIIVSALLFLTSVVVSRSDSA